MVIQSYKRPLITPSTLSTQNTLVISFLYLLLDTLLLLQLIAINLVNVFYANYKTNICLGEL